MLDIQIDQAISAANIMSKMAREQGDLPTMYAANRAWHTLTKAKVDRTKRVSALSNGDRG